MTNEPTQKSPAKAKPPTGRLKRLKRRLRRIADHVRAAVFCIAGVGCGITAFKIFLFQRKLDRVDQSEPYRDNVRIHIEEHEDF